MKARDHLTTPGSIPSLLLALLAATLVACPTLAPKPRPRVTDDRPQPRKPTNQYAKAPAPFVAIMPGAKLYARPDLKAPYVQLGLNHEGKVPARTCGQMTALPTAVRALRHGHGWVEVETAATEKAVGDCIDRIGWSKQIRFRAWVQRTDLGTVVRKTLTATYGEKLKVKLRAGTAVLARMGKPGMFCAELNLPQWQAMPRGQHTYHWIKLPPKAVGAFFKPEQWATATKPTRQACWSEMEDEHAGPCPMRTPVRGQRALSGGDSAVWMDSKCARNEVIVGTKEIKKLTGGGGRAAGATPSGGTGGVGFGGWGGFGKSGGGSVKKTKPSYPPVPTLLKGNTVFWLDGTRAGKIRDDFTMKLGRTFWRQGKLCTRDKLGLGKGAGFCFTRAAGRVGPLPRGKGKDSLEYSSGYRSAPGIKLPAATGGKINELALRSTVKAHLGHLELCHVRAEKAWYGTAKVRVAVDAKGRMAKISFAATPSKPLAKCLVSLLRLLKLKSSTVGPAGLTVQFTKESAAPGIRGFGVGRYSSRGPRVFMSRASVTGGLDAATIRRVIRRHLSEIKYCYITVGLTAKKALKGMVKVHFTIASDGKVDTASIGTATLKHAPTHKCILKAVKAWRFPKPEGSKPNVMYPFHFKPKG